MWDEALELGEQFGLRNSQATVSPPTGTAGILLSFDTFSGEPGLSEVGFKTLAGGGYLTIVMEVIGPALDNLGYSKEERDSIMEFVLAKGGVRDRGTGDLAPGLKSEPWAFSRPRSVRSRSARWAISACWSVWRPGSRVR